LIRFILAQPRVVIVGAFAFHFFEFAHLVLWRVTTDFVNGGGGIAVGRRIHNSEPGRGHRRWQDVPALAVVVVSDVDLGRPLAGQPRLDRILAGEGRIADRDRRVGRHDIHG